MLGYAVHGPGAITLEWRVPIPVPGYVRPKGVATEDVLPTVAFRVVER